jgi:hypothetical protein
MFPGLKDLNAPKALYAAEVTALDQQLRRLLGHPAMQDACIAFTSHHLDEAQDPRVAGRADH